MSEHRSPDFSSIVDSLTPERRALLMMQLRKENGQRLDLPLVGINTRGTRRPFFCVHSEGGGTYFYAPLSHYLGVDQPFYALQARGLEADGLPHTSIPEMATYYIQAIRRLQPHGPYMIGGWCLGGIIAFEMAHQLLVQGESTVLLALMDASAPPYPFEAYDMTMAISSFLGLAHAFIGQGSSRSHALPDDLKEEEQLRYLSEQLKQFDRNELRKFNSVVPEMGLDALRKILHVYESNAKAVQGYTPPLYPDRVTYFKAVDPTPFSDTTHYVDFWRQQTTQPLEVQFVPGHHMSFLQDPTVEYMAMQLRKCIDQAITGP